MFKLFLLAICCFPLFGQDCLLGEVTKGALTVSCKAIDMSNVDYALDQENDPFAGRYLLSVKVKIDDPSIIGIRVIMNIPSALQPGSFARIAAVLLRPPSLTTDPTSTASNGKPLTLGHVFNLPASVNFSYTITVEEIRVANPQAF